MHIEIFEKIRDVLDSKAIRVVKASDEMETKTEKKPHRLLTVLVELEITSTYDYYKHINLSLYKKGQGTLTNFRQAYMYYAVSILHKKKINDHNSRFKKNRL